MDSVKRYIQFVKPYKWTIIGTIIIGIIKFAIPLLIPLLTKYVVDDIVGNKSISTDYENRTLILGNGHYVIYFCRTETAN